MAMKSFKSVEEYLAAQSPEVQAALRKLSKQIKTLVPKAEEVISYGLPVFKYHYMLVGYGAAARHCALYVMSPSLMKKLKTALAPYDTATATIRFSPDRPLPAALVKKIVLARLAENEERNAVRVLKKPLKKVVVKKKSTSKK